MKLFVVASALALAASVGFFGRYTMLRPRLGNVADKPLEARPCVGFEFNFNTLD